MLVVAALTGSNTGLQDSSYESWQAVSLDDTSGRTYFPFVDDRW